MKSKTIAVLGLILMMAACTDSPTPEELAIKAKQDQAIQRGKEQLAQERLRQEPAGAKFLGVAKPVASIFVSVDGAPNHIDPAIIANITCFNVGLSHDQADGTLEISTEMLPPPGRESVSLADCDVKYSGILRTRQGRALWHGSRSTRVPILNMPGYYKPNGITPDQAEAALLGDLARTACH